MPLWSTWRKPKPKPEEDLPDFDQDFMSLLRQIMPQGVIPTGWPLYRRGGSYRHWTTAGVGNYVPTGFTQIGVYEWTGSSSTYVNEIITLPKKYSGHYLNWTAVIFQDPEYIWTSCCGIWVNDETLRIVTWAESGIVHVKIAWLTMGPGAG